MNHPTYITFAGTTNNEEIEIPPFDFGAFMTETDPLFGIAMPNWITFIVIFICMTYIYNKVFRARKLPLLKDLVVYVLLAIGAFVLLIFEVDSSLPIVYSLSIAIALMLTLRIRYFVMDWQNRKQNK
ncbi:YlaH-like family protein [Marinicrinis sediminis]|uniref:YlaH-like family protein n=1 Tax=Marinicrinis sediminis TaxID=1652465 RepID=A0ABW5RBG7_9BACL